MKNIQADALLLVGTCIGASMYQLTDFVMTEMTPLNYLGLRFLILVPLLYPFVARRLSLYSFTILARSCVTGFAMVAAFLFLAYGIQKTEHIGIGAFIVSLEGLMIPLLGRLLFGEKLSLWTFLGLPFALAGLSLFGLDGDQFSLHVSDLYFFLAGLSFALFVVFNKHFNREIDNLSGLWMQFLGGAIISVPSLLLFDEIMLDYSTSIWLTLVYFIVIGTGLRCYIMVVAYPHTSSSHAGLILICEPIIAALIDWFYTGSQLSYQQLAGCGLILVSCLISMLPALFFSKRKMSSGNINSG